MAEQDQRAAADIAAYETRNSEAGLMTRYAVGRLRHFWARQVLTVAGALVLGTLISPALGATAFAVALLGEIVDCALLRQVPEMLKRGVSVSQVRIATTISGLFQALTITACVLLGWFAIPDQRAALFTFAFLAGAAINAGLFLPFHPHAAQIRLSVYGATVIGLVAQIVAATRTLTDSHYFDIAGALMLAFMVRLFLNFVQGAFWRHGRNERDLVRRGEMLEKTLSDLRAKESEARNLALVARKANDSVVMTDANGTILWVNEAFTRITGYTAQEAIGRVPRTLLNGPETDPETADRLAREVRAGNSIRTEILSYRKDGRKFWMETNIVPILSASGQVEMVVSIERDTTEARESAEQIARAVNAAKQAARAKSEFLATMSHEIRTPMNAILGMADLLLERDLDEEAALYASTIQSSAAALLGILNDVLDLSKLDAGRLSLAPVNFSPADCIESVVAMFRAGALAKGLTLKLELPPDLPATLYGDDHRLRQIIVNIVGNAIKFTDKGAVVVRAHHNRAGPRHRLWLEVIDSGIGIAAEAQARVFDQFSQAEGSTTRRFGGTGMGLTISRLLAQQMGGDISVASRRGEGAVFTVEVFLDDPRTEDQVPPDTPRLETDIPPGLRVLVAEDNAANRLLISKYLGDAPVELQFAENGEEAVARWAATGADVIFMDMAMPVMDGLAATAEIRARPGGAAPRIIALTANAMEADRQACLEAGMDDFLTKPVRKAAILGCIAAAAGATGAPEMAWTDRAS